MKKSIFLLLLVAFNFSLLAQNTTTKYPTPEYNNEIYFFNKEAVEAVRLEKGFSKVQSKTKMGGMGGGENAYTLEGGKSDVRIPYGKLNFIFYTGEAIENSNPESDSFMRANGINPSSMGDPTSMLSDPSRTTSLYGMNVEKGERKITLMSYQGMKLLGKAKKESTKYTMSIKSVKKGYYILEVDKPLPKGEYAFLVMDGMGMSMDGSSKLFAFGVD